MFTYDSHQKLEGTGLAGRLLVSIPQMDNGPFAKSVVLMISHDTDHAFGIIVNKPIIGLMAADAIYEVRLSPALTSENAPVYFGGPCDTQRGMVLHSAEYRGQDTRKVGQNLAITTTKDALERLYGEELRPQTSRLIAGHAGWTGGQLDDELRRNFWMDMEATAEFVFGEPVETMWEAAYRQMGVDISSLSALNAFDHGYMSPLN